MLDLGLFICKQWSTNNTEKVFFSLKGISVTTGQTRITLLLAVVQQLTRRENSVRATPTSCFKGTVIRMLTAEVVGVVSQVCLSYVRYN